MNFLFFLLFFVKFVSSQKHDDDYLNDVQYGDDIIISNDERNDDINDNMNRYDDVDEFFGLKSFSNYLSNYISNFVSRNLIACDSTVINKVVDWTNIYTSPVKSAGFCLSSGWAFAAVDQIESDTIRMHGTGYKYVLSAQQLLDCVSYNDGCGGGKIEQAYNYLLTSGLEQSNNYPYSSYFGVAQRCTQHPSLAVVKLNGYYNFLTGNEGCMASYVQKNGPITVCLSTSLSWFTYTGGVMTLSSCPATNNINHCLQVVGVFPNVNGGYWKLKNSFGTVWGENGHIRIAYGSNVCNIINNPIYTTPTVDL